MQIINSDNNNFKFITIINSLRNTVLTYFINIEHICLLPTIVLLNSSNG